MVKIETHHQKLHEFHRYQNCKRPSRPNHSCSWWKWHKISFCHLESDTRTGSHWNKTETRRRCCSWDEPSNMLPNSGSGCFFHPCPFCRREQHVSIPLCHNWCTRQMFHGRRSRHIYRYRMLRQNLVLVEKRERKKKENGMNINHKKSFPTSSKSVRSLFNKKWHFWTAIGLAKAKINIWWWMCRFSCHLRSSNENTKEKF